MPGLAPQLSNGTSLARWEGETEKEKFNIIILGTKWMPADITHCTHTPCCLPHVLMTLLLACLSPEPTPGQGQSDLNPHLSNSKWRREKVWGTSTLWEGEKEPYFCHTHTHTHILISLTKGRTQHTEIWFQVFPSFPPISSPNWCSLWRLTWRDLGGEKREGLAGASCLS